MFGVFVREQKTCMSYRKIMKLNSHISNESDIKKYKGIAAMACRKPRKDNQEQVPTFIVQEAIEYYCGLEKYEICHSIKTFFDRYTKYLITSTREEWYGKKQEKSKNN